MDEKLIWSAISNEELLAEVANRGLELPQAKAAGAFACEGAQVSSDWALNLADQYELSVAALGELGFTEADGIPAFQQVTAGLGENNAVWLNDRKASGDQDELVIVPNIESIGLMGTSRKPGLIPRFDRKQSKNDKTYVYNPLWDKSKDKDPIHDNFLNEQFGTAVLLGDVTNPRDHNKPANDYQEPGLVFTSMKVPAQRDALKTEAAEHAAQGRQLRNATIGQIVLVNAQRRLQGKPFLDTQTYTRLTHYPDVKLDGDACVPDVGANDRQLGLFGSNVQDGWGSSGVRRALRIAKIQENV
ncbi:MAG: hypothetical protein ABIV43_00120 [Candidatus Saccharimonadales bacterium]